MASEIEASGEPFPRWNIKLSTAFIRKGLEVENSVLESNRVEGLAVSNRSKLEDGDAVRSRV